MQSQVSNEIPEIRLPSPSPELRSSLFSGRLSLCFWLLPFSRACPSQVATKRDECKGNDDWMRFSWEGSHPSGQRHISGARPLWVRLPFYNHEAHMPFPSWASGRQLQAPAWVRGRDKWQRVCHSTSWLALLQRPAFMGGRGERCGRENRADALPPSSQPRDPGRMTRLLWSKLAPMRWGPVRLRAAVPWVRRHHSGPTPRILYLPSPLQRRALFYVTTKKYFR